MAELKTKRNKQSVKDFLNTVEDEKKRTDCFTIVKLMQEITGNKPEMWGDSIVGFGSYHYKSASGREGDWFLVGFSPRKQNLAIYLIGGSERKEALFKKLGKHKTGKSCLYINQLKDVDMDIFKELIKESVKKLSKG